MTKKRSQATWAPIAAGLAAVLALVLAGADARAAEDEPEPELIGDRPDFTESSATVAPLHLQAELGAAYSTLGGGSELSLPNALLRFGVHSNVELRLEPPTALATRERRGGVPATNGGESGNQPVGDAAYEPRETVDVSPGPVALGAKGVLGIGENAAIGLLPMFGMPVKAGQLSEEGAELTLRGVWAVDLNSVFALGGNLGVVLGGLGVDDVTPEYLWSLSLGIAITDAVGTFVEYWSSMDEDFAVGAVFDSGFTFLVTPRFQLDIHYGVGLAEAEGFEVGGGAIILI